MHSAKENTQTQNKGKRQDANTKMRNGQPSRMMVHAKLEMTAPSDFEEREADAMADTVVSGGKISRKVEGNASQGGIAVPSGMESQLSQMQGGGRAMPEGLRNMMESGFGQDFSAVRLHTDSQAAEMSSAIHARAFTHGNDIYFNQGQFAPETTSGQHLIAHELAHVAQGTGRVARKEEAEGDEAPSSSAETANAKKAWKAGSEDTALVDENQVAWSKSLSMGLEGFNADNKAMVDLINSMIPKLESINKQKKEILKIANPATAEELELPDYSLQDLKEVEQARVSSFNNVKNAAENSRKDKKAAKDTLKDAVDEFQAMGQALTLLSDEFDYYNSYMKQLRAHVEEDLKHAASMLRFEIGDRRSSIYVKYEKVAYGLQLLRDTKDNAVFFVRWTAAPSESELDAVGGKINTAKPHVQKVYDLKDEYYDKLEKGQAPGNLPFESYAALSEWAKNFNDKVQSTGQQLYDIDINICNLRNGSIDSAENWVTGLKITSELCFAISTSVIPGAGAAKAVSMFAKSAKMVKYLNSASAVTRIAARGGIVLVSAGAGAAANVVGKGMEHGLLKLSDTYVKHTSGNGDNKDWNFYKMPTLEDYEKAGISGAITGAASGALKVGAEAVEKAAKAEKAGEFVKGADKFLKWDSTQSFASNRVFGKIGTSTENILGVGFSLLGDKTANVLIDGDAQWSWWDLAYGLGALKVKKGAAEDSIDNLKERERELLGAHKRNRGINTNISNKKRKIRGKKADNRTAARNKRRTEKDIAAVQRRQEKLKAENDALQSKLNDARATKTSKEKELAEIRKKKDKCKKNLDKLDAGRSELTNSLTKADDSIASAQSNVQSLERQIEQKKITRNFKRNNGMMDASEGMIADNELSQLESQLAENKQIIAQAKQAKRDLGSKVKQMDRKIASAKKQYNAYDKTETKLGQEIKSSENAAKRYEQRISDNNLRQANNEVENIGLGIDHSVNSLRQNNNEQEIARLKEEIQGLEGQRESMGKYVWNWTKAKAISDVTVYVDGAMGATGTAIANNASLHEAFEDEESVEGTLPYQYDKMQEDFRFNTTYIYKMPIQYRVFFGSGSAIIDDPKEMETIIMVANKIKEMKSYGNVRVSLTGQASPRWQVKKNEEHGIQLNEELASNRNKIVREALVDQLINTGVNVNEIASAIRFDENISITLVNHKDDIDNKNNLANLRNVIIVISME